MSKEFKGVFVFAEQKNGVIHRVSYELLGKGRELADKLNVELVCGVFGPKGMDVQELVYHGADKVYYGSHDSLFDFPEEMIYCANVVNLLKEITPEVCLFGATSFGRSIAPRIAAEMESGLTADCTGLDIDDDGGLIQIRPAFSENILAHIRSKSKPQMATVRYKEFSESLKNIEHKGKIINVDVMSIDNPQVTVLQEIMGEDFDITSANVVISVGKGLKTPEDMKLIYELAEVMGGEVGVSRPLVEEGYSSKSHQVGYSGNRVKPKVYVACGISGAPQHLAGMKDSNYIIAINSDPSAPIFKIADCGIVGDLYEVIPQFIDSIKNKKN